MKYAYAFIEYHISKGELILIKEIELFTLLEEGRLFLQTNEGKFFDETTHGWRHQSYRLVKISGDDYTVLPGERPLNYGGIESTPHIIRKKAS